MNRNAVLAEAREQTDALFDTVRPEALYDRPIAERHRIVFYLGHLEAFDWNLLRPYMKNAPVFHAEFDRLFAFGIDPVDGGLPADVPSDWPVVAEILSYSARVRQVLDSAEHDQMLLRMAEEHRLMHAETLAYMLHQLPYERKIASLTEYLPAGEVQRGSVVIPAGVATLGAPRDGRFGWDNEFDEHRVEVPFFSVDRYKVTNGDYLRFVDAGGYRDRSLWRDADWRWKTEAGIVAPAFWVETAGGWRYRGMFAETAMPLDSPAYVSHAEASAYAIWVGARLPSEAEWHRAELLSASGVDGLIGTGWEWTSTIFAPFAGFEAHPSYPGYSADFFDGKHYVLKGGSPRTAQCMLRRSFRNWFQPHYQYLYGGFRCARGV